jgi:hypothetical protein
MEGMAYMRWNSHKQKNRTRNTPVIATPAQPAPSQYDVTASEQKVKAGSMVNSKTAEAIEDILSYFRLSDTAQE